MANKKPDPIDLGFELADYIKEKWDKYNKLHIELSKSVGDYDALYDALTETLTLSWERDFWRAKALQIKLP